VNAPADESEAMINVITHWHALTQQCIHGQVVAPGASAPPFQGTTLDARRPLPRLIILDWSPSRRVGVRRQITARIYLTLETLCSRSGIHR
jgi:hypothetical protein